MQTIETIFENGVFRPLTTVAFAERQRVTLRVEDADPSTNGASKLDRRPACVDPDDDYPYPPLDLEYQSVPMEVVGTIKVKIVDGGECPPMPYPTDD